MKSLKYFLFLNCICLISCEDVDSNLNLKRNNPLDEYYNMQDGISIQFEDYFVYDDDNCDDIINKGETIEMYVHLTNTGKNIADKVKVSFSTTSPYISSISYYNSDLFLPNTTTTCYLCFTVANNIPVNTKITFDINIKHGSNHSWKDSFNIIVDPL